MSRGKPVLFSEILKPRCVVLAGRGEWEKINKVLGEHGSSARDREIVECCQMVRKGDDGLGVVMGCWKGGRSVPRDAYVSLIDAAKKADESKNAYLLYKMMVEVDGHRPCFNTVAAAMHYPATTFDLTTYHSLLVQATPLASSSHTSKLNDSLALLLSNMNSITPTSPLYLTFRKMCDLLTELHNRNQKFYKECKQRHTGNPHLVVLIKRVHKICGIRCKIA
eukprot:TRINITY_DN3593_c0_g1_i6.p1 TRINITY_DN3593_c0_g1~~TRINITY_DN3593_c0_g1_i6.p1  ORF type:complete len:222 (+),score=16.95 TRINITY_DN3593_c0_g1_i6:65-730(+)